MEYYKETIIRLVIAGFIAGLIIAQGVILIINGEYLAGIIIILLSLLTGYVIFKIGE